jgi:hypothetical protein
MRSVSPVETDKFHHRIDHGGTRVEYWCSSILSLTSVLDVLDDMVVQLRVPADLPPGNTRYPLYRRLVGRQGRCGRLWKISPPKGFDPRPVHLVASRYTD